MFSDDNKQQTLRQSGFRVCILPGSFVYVLHLEIILARLHYVPTQLTRSFLDSGIITERGHTRNILNNAIWH